MKEHPEIVDDINKLENSDLHDWELVGEVVEPTLEKDGYADYVCRIDKCGQTKRVVLPKLTPEESGSVETREVGVIFWDAAAQAAPAALQGKVLSADEQTATAEKAQVESLLADKANWKLAEDVGDLMIHPAADAAGTVYEQAVKASGCRTLRHRQRDGTVNCCLRCSAAAGRRRCKLAGGGGHCFQRHVPAGRRLCAGPQEPPHELRSHFKSHLLLLCIPQAARQVPQTKGLLQMVTGTLPAWRRPSPW